MTNTIPNVPRELLERVLNAGWGSETVNALDDLRDFLESAPSPANHVEDVRAMVAAPSPAGVDGLEVVAWVTTGFSGKSRTRRAFTVNADDAARQHTNWTPHYRQVTTDQLCRLSDAQAIIDGLRGEVDQQAQRIGELASHLEFAVTLLTVAGLAGNAQVEAMRAALSAGHEPKQCT